MSKWFLITLAIVFLASVIVIIVRAQGRKDAERLEKEDFVADDFEILE